MPSCYLPECQRRWLGGAWWPAQGCPERYGEQSCCSPCQVPFCRYEQPRLQGEIWKGKTFCHLFHLFGCLISVIHLKMGNLQGNPEEKARFWIRVREKVKPIINNYWSNTANAFKKNILQGKLKDYFTFHDEHILINFICVLL